MEVAADTKRAVRDFGLAAAAHLLKVIPEQEPDFSVGERWERGADGHFRERRGRTPNLWVLFGNDWLSSLPGYESCVAQMRSDPCVARHLDHLVGTQHMALRIDPETILSGLIYSMFDDNGDLTSADENLMKKWQQLATFLQAERVSSTTIVPIPHLAIPEFPLRLNNELVLDRFSDSEVTRCYQVGVIRSQSPGLAFVDESLCLGARRTLKVPKLVQEDGGSTRESSLREEGSFGHRPIFRDALVTEDVLSAFRLFKSTKARASGHATWTESPWHSGTSYHALQQAPYGGFSLSAEELPRFEKLWKLMEQGDRRFGFSTHRFSLAFDRDLLVDQIVDLVIAAESLLLSDLGTRDRGELRFRFALRAAKFIRHPLYNEQMIYRVMRRAYDARSAIVHAGVPEDTRLPDNEDAKLPAFTNAVEELVRIGLQKGLAMQDEAKELQEPQYWDALMFTNPASS